MYIIQIFNSNQSEEFWFPVQVLIVPFFISLHCMEIVRKVLKLLAVIDNSDNLKFI